MKHTDCEYSIQNGVMQDRLSDTDRDEIAAILAEAPTPYTDFERFHTWVRQQFPWRKIPAEIITQLERIRRGEATAPAVLILPNLPNDDFLPATPSYQPTTLLKKSYRAEAIILGITTQLAVPIGYTREKKGAIVHSIVPSCMNSNTRSNEGLSLLQLHRENPQIGRLCPHFVSLFCLRSDRDRVAITSFVDTRIVYLSLPEAVKVFLRRPPFTVKAPESFGPGGP